MTDYDDVRSCCSGADICSRCWPLMTAAVKVVEHSLRNDFGFKHLLFVYSGRRGIHCWVCDKSAREMSGQARTAVIEYLSVYMGEFIQSFRGLPFACTSVGSVPTNELYISVWAHTPGNDQNRCPELSYPIHPSLMVRAQELTAVSTCPRISASKPSRFLSRNHRNHQLT